MFAFINITMNRFIYRVLIVLLLLITAAVLYEGNSLFLLVGKTSQTSEDKRTAINSIEETLTSQPEHNLLFPPGKKSAPKRSGKFSGSPGQHKYFYTKERDWFIDPQTVSKFCRATNFTQCSPPPKRAQQEKDADRAGRKPFQVTVYLPFLPDQRDPNFSECEYTNCVYNGKQVTPDSDAVYMYGVSLSENVPYPNLRLPHQTFIFAVYESPVNLFYNNFLGRNSKWIKYFNATMTYRKKADIFKPYGILDFQPKASKDLPNYREIARNKSRSVIWLVSNCKTQSNRWQYVKELQKYIDVDIFGNCGQKCEMKDERCVSDISTTYRFYLSFENSFSTDYVTEKFFKLFIDDMHVVPVVRGAFDYNKELPEKSLINSANFRGPKELAMFLKSLEADEEEYIRYLEVKDRYRALHELNHWCPVCKYLHLREKSPEKSRHKVVNIRDELNDSIPPVPLLL